MSIPKVLVAGAVSVFTVSTAAQDFLPLVRERIVLPSEGGQGSTRMAQSGTVTLQSSGAARPESHVRVQVGINLLIPAPSAEGAEADKVRDQARRSIYEHAMRECDLLREVLAKECRLEAINVNVNRQAAPGMAANFNVIGQLTLPVTLK